MLPKYSYTRTTCSSATPGRARYLESEPVVTSVFLACANEHMRRRIAKLLAATVDIEVVGEAGDGSQAVEGVQMVRPDVLLMEIDLPGLYEPNAAAELARACPDISIIVLTSFARRDLLARIDVGERGARGTKGNALEEFLIAIRTLGPGEVLKYPPR